MNRYRSLAPIQGATIGDIHSRFAQAAFQAPPALPPLGRRIRFLEPPQITAHWWQNLTDKTTWLPTYGMTGTIIDLPPRGAVDAGPKIRWDDGHETWLGPVSQYEFIS